MLEILYVPNNLVVKGKVMNVLVGHITQTTGCHWTPSILKIWINRRFAMLGKAEGTEL